MHTTPSLRIVFAGTSLFSVPILNALIENRYPVVSVYTQPDRPAGRGQKLRASPVKICALENDLPVHQPSTLRTDEIQNQIRTERPDVWVVAAYGLILPATVLEIPTYGCINVHGSLLPRWRGAAPIQRSILEGDPETGVAIMKMETGLDTGPILQQSSCPILATDTAATLQEKLSHLGAELLIDTLSHLEKYLSQASPQPTEGACYATKIEKSDAKIQWQQSTVSLDRMVRAFYPSPIAYFMHDNQPIRVVQASSVFQATGKLPGTIVASTKNGIDVVTKDGILRLLQIQLPGKKAVYIHELINALPPFLREGMILGD